jgi:hypothetical protein
MVIWRAGWVRRNSSAAAIGIFSYVIMKIGAHDLRRLGASVKPFNPSNPSYLGRTKEIAALNRVFCGVLVRS